MYDLDVKAARAADTSGASIKEMGKYVGAFTQARALISKNTGAHGIEFQFKSASGQKANLPIYTKSADGKQYQGYDLLMAIMACQGLRTIKQVLGTATRYDFDARKDVQEECNIFPDLCKPIGVLLETEDYYKQNGELATRMVFKSVFQPSTELTASEILDRKTSPVQLEKMVAGLKHRPAKQAAVKPTQHATGYQHSGPAPLPSRGFDTLDDDIPFATSSMYYDATTSKQRRMAKYSY